MLNSENSRTVVNLVVLVTAAAYFAATFLGQQMKLRILTEKLLVISQRFFGIPPFRFYALADGIRRVLSGSAFQPMQESPPDTQLELALICQPENSGESPGEIRLDKTKIVRIKCVISNGESFQNQLP